MTHSQVEDVLPLAPLQEGLLFLSEYDSSGRDVYVVQFVFDLRGTLDAGRMRAAAESLVASQASLRTSFRHQRRQGSPVQVIRRSAQVPWATLDLSGLAPQKRQAELERLLEEDRQRRFDPARRLLMRFT